MASDAWLTRTLMEGAFIALCTSEEIYFEVMEDMEVTYPLEWLPEDCFGRTHYFDHTCMVCVNPKDDRSGIDVAGTLCHEATHVFQRYCDSIGEIDPSKEFEAYSIQAIFKTLMHEYARQTGMIGQKIPA